MTLTPEIIDLINQISKALGPAYKFGYHENEDMIQEAFILALQGLESYDKKRGVTLKTFLYHHVRNRLSTLKRDKYFRQNYKCPHCDTECNHCFKQRLNADRRKNLLDPVSIDNVRDQNEQNMHDNLEPFQVLELKELLEEVEDAIPIELRPDYLRLKSGERIQHNRKQKLLSIINEVIYG
jgi:DNA-directed RNA polymerase specialized sigma24 family protein